MKRYPINSILCGVLTALVAIGSSGCTMFPERQDFGDAVRHMQAIQDATPETQGFAQDGQRGRLILQTFREDVAKPAEIKNEIVINVGSGSQ